MTYRAIVEICRNKRDVARVTDYNFDQEDYLWLIGIDIFRVLQDGLSVDLFVNTSTSIYTYSLMGIGVQIDYENKDVIKLYKEV